MRAHELLAFLTSDPSPHPSLPRPSRRPLVELPYAVILDDRTVPQRNLPVRRGVVGEFIPLERLFPGQGATTAFLEAPPLPRGADNASASANAYRRQEEVRGRKYSAVYP